MAIDRSKNIAKITRSLASVFCIVVAALMLVGAISTRYPLQFQSSSSYTMVQASGEPLQYILLGILFLVAGLLLFVLPSRRSNAKS